MRGKVSRYIFDLSKRGNPQTNEQMENLTTFTDGLTYVMGYIGDSELKTNITVTRRTAKSVWISYRGEEKRCKIHTNDTCLTEFIYPDGRYSMASILRADKPLEIVETVELTGEAKIRAQYATEDVDAAIVAGGTFITDTAHGTINVEHADGLFTITAKGIELLVTRDRFQVEGFVAAAYTVENADEPTNQDEPQVVGDTTTPAAVAFILGTDDDCRRTGKAMLAAGERAAVAINDLGATLRKLTPAIKAGDRVSAVINAPDSFYQYVEGTVTEVKANGWIAIDADRVKSKWDDVTRKHPGTCSMAAPAKDVKKIKD